MGKAIIIILVFLVVGGLMIAAANDYELSQKNDRKSFFGDFGRWVWHLGKNMKDVTAMVIRQTWLPDVPEEPGENITITTIQVE